MNYTIYHSSTWLLKKCEYVFIQPEYFILGFFFMKVKMTLVIRKRRYIGPDRINTVPFHLVASKTERRENTD